MNILVLGIDDISFLFRNTYMAFKKEYNSTTFFNVKKYKKISKHISKNIEFFLFRKHLFSTNPQLIFIVAPYYIKKEYFEIINEYKIKHDCLVYGWVGDKFLENDYTNFVSSSLDKKFITDTYFKKLYKNNSDVVYLPLCTNPDIFKSKNYSKKYFSTFIGTGTPYRENMITKVNFQLNVFGNAWERLQKKYDNKNLNISTKKTNIKQTAKIYNLSETVLNLTNETNVVNGLNQRTFDPFLCNALVLQEDCKDLEYCFEPDKEILVFNTIDELNDKVKYISSNRKEYFNILDKGRKRVLLEHTFENRVKKIMGEI